MSFDTTSNRVTYTGAGNLDTYGVPFPFFDEEDLTLELVNTDDVVVPLVLDTDYTVDVENEEITLLSGNLSSGYLLTIRRVLPIVQETELRNQGPYFPETIEAALDRSAMISQQIQEQIDRSVHISSADEPVDMELPIAALRAGKFLAFDTDGTPIMASGITSVPVSAFMETLLDDTTASAGLTTLGFSTFFKTLIGAVDASALQTLLGMSTFFKTLLSAASATAFRSLVNANIAITTQTETVAEWAAWPTGDDLEWGDLDTIVLQPGTYELYFQVRLRITYAAPGAFSTAFVGMGTTAGDVAASGDIIAGGPNTNLLPDGTYTYGFIGNTVPVVLTPVVPTTYYLKGMCDSESDAFASGAFEYASKIFARKVA